MSKVICGDSGDNIKALIRVYHKTQKGKIITKKVSEKEWLAVKESLNIHSIKNFENNKKLIINKLLSIPRLSGCDASMEELIEMFDYNMTMVRLDKEQIPRIYQLAMNKHKDDYIVTDMDYLRNNYKVLAAHTTQVEMLFEDLPF